MFGLTGSDRKLILQSKTFGCTWRGCISGLTLDLNVGFSLYDSENKVRGSHAWEMTRGGGARSQRGKGWAGVEGGHADGSIAAVQGSGSLVGHRPARRHLPVVTCAKVDETHG